MKNLKRIAAGSIAATALGIAVGAGGAVANAAPPAAGAEWAQQPWIGPGGPGGPGGPPPPPPPGFGGPGFGGPPPPAPFAGYGGYNNGYGGYGYGQPCLSGPLGFLQLCI